MRNYICSHTKPSYLRPVIPKILVPCQRNKAATFLVVKTFSNRSVSDSGPCILYLQEARRFWGITHDPLHFNSGHNRALGSFRIILLLLAATSYDGHLTWVTHGSVRFIILFGHCSGCNLIVFIVRFHSRVHRICQYILQQRTILRQCRACVGYQNTFIKRRF